MFVLDLSSSMHTHHSDKSEALFQVGARPLGQSSSIGTCQIRGLRGSISFTRISDVGVGIVVGV